MLSMLAMSAAILAAGQTGQQAQEKQTQVVEKSDGQDVPSPPKIRVVDIPTPPPIRIAAPPPPPPPPPAPPVLDPASAVTPVKPRGLARWSSLMLYPVNSMFLLEEGMTHYALSITTNGRVLDCDVRQSSGFDRLDRDTCRQLTRYGRFYPAQNAAGEAVPGTYVGSIRWSVDNHDAVSNGALGWTYPQEALDNSEEGSVSVALQIAPSGIASQCEVTKSSGSSSLDAATCERIREMRGLTPGFDRNGAAIARQFRRTVDWQLPELEDEEL